MFALDDVPDAAATGGRGASTARWSPATSCSPARSGAPTCPAATTRRCSARCARSSLPLPDARLVLPGHGPTTTIAPRAGHQPVPARTDRVEAPGHDATHARLSGFPEWLPAERARRAARPRRPAPHASSCTGSPRSRPAPSSRSSSLLRKGGDLQGGLRLRPPRRRRTAAGDADARPALRPHRAVRAVRAGERRARSRSRSGATRSRRCGAGSGRRTGASASSSRPTSTSSAPATLPYHYEVELPLVMAEAFVAALLGVPRVPDPGQQPQGRRGLLPRARADRRRRPCCASSTSSTRSAPDAVAELLVEAGRDEEQARACLELAAISGTDALVRRRACAPCGVQHPSCSTRASSELSALIAAAAGAGARRRRRRPAGSPAGSTTTPARSTRRVLVGHEQLGSICSGGRYDTLASDGRTPTRASACRSASPGSCACSSPRGPDCEHARRRPRCSSP